MSLRIASLVALAFVLICNSRVFGALVQQWEDEKTRDGMDVRITLSKDDDGYYVFVHIFEKCDDLDYGMNIRPSHIGLIPITLIFRPSYYSALTILRRQNGY